MTTILYFHGSYTGQIKVGTKTWHGYGIAEWTNKDGSKEEYKGCWKDNRQYGYGTYTWPDGSVYEGQWTGFKQGVGLYFYPNGDKYEGEWREDKPHGIGIKWVSKKGRYEGSWKFDNKDGYGNWYNARGKNVSSGIWVQDKFQH
mmetsp:Transcript_18050/g.20215  ORF Transcript_18050/g.20215 Transcript_18050/m.20215 type:complete len:144 (+) Transcript_18050:152-583(+)